MPHLPVPFSKVEWWKRPRPQVLEDMESSLELPVSEVVHRLKVFLWEYARHDKESPYMQAARILGGAGTAHDLFQRIVIQGKVSNRPSPQLALFPE
jgi:hypothetical protein